MADPIRIPPEEVREKVTSGNAILVCGYDDPDKFAQNHLEGAISFAEFKSRLPSLSKDQEIIVYCA
ncbi:MAG: rhodanese-like domain-containing protein [Desulfobacteraceae bacterium]|jgi:rhodanese-related sulfurtransferase